MVQITYELRARQQTSLTPRLQQSVKLLQMSTLEFSSEVAQAIATNPFLEESEDPSSSGAVPETDSEKNDGAVQPDTAFPSEIAAIDATSEVPGETPQTQYCEIDQTRPDYTYSGDYPAPRDPHQSDTDVSQWARSETGLCEALHENLCGYSLNARDRLLVEFVIEALDEDGYLRLPFSQLTPGDHDPFIPVVTGTEWEAALRLVQQLAAPGLAARNLTECLSLQLAALPEQTKGLDLAQRIVADCLDKLGKCDYAGLARCFASTEDDIRQACALIRQLDPRPARRYASIDPSSYVVPDVVVRKIGKLWTAMPDRDAMPRVQLHTAYAQLFRESRYGERSLMAGALQEARWLIRSLEQRSATIQRVAQAIVARQQTFFDYGEIALRPLMLSTIADELDMHESTVSRATSNKYMATSQGIYEFKHFFSRELTTRSGGTCSAGAVRALIQEMIDEENSDNPLSDVVLAEKLAHGGVIVARRTVTKYRTQIKIPPAESRRAP